MTVETKSERASRNRKKKRDRKRETRVRLRDTGRERDYS